MTAKAASAIVAQNGKREEMFESHRQVHIINPLRDAAGGSEWRSLSLFNELKGRCDVQLWSEYEPDPLLLKQYPIKRIVPKQRRFPKTGVLVFVGAYYLPGRWVYFTWPRRTVLIYNTFNQKRLKKALRRLSAGGLRKVEMVYASELIRKSIDRPGVIHASLIDIHRFVPSMRKPVDTTCTDLTVGRLSRDDLKKHHPDDAGFYRELADRGFRIRIMGGICLTPELSSIPSITLLPTCAEEPHLFLQGLDCFFYRTSDQWLEPSGRVVLEAMACGLPVICHNRGGYVEVIDHGRNGFLFDTELQALEILLRLKNGSLLRESIGKAARETVEEIFSPMRRSEIAEFFLH